MCILEALLFANENQNARCQRQETSYDHRDGEMNESHDSNKDQVNSEQKHSEVFGDVHAPFWSKGSAFARLIAHCWTSPDLRRNQNRVTHAV